MDTVELLVEDLDAQTEFYRRAVTLDVLDQSVRAQSSDATASRS